VAWTQSLVQVIISGVVTLMSSVAKVSGSGAILGPVVDLISSDGTSDGYCCPAGPDAYG
jgi:hypothetical protein